MPGHTFQIDFKRSSKVAIADKKLKRALVSATDRFRAQRSLAVEGTQEWEEIKTRAREIKEHVIDNLDFYLEKLEESITKAGGVVHWARDGEEAANIITAIAAERGVKSVVKSKSMATEEIELNNAFERNGIKVVETDLGEYIIQLAGERPSHILAPAIHKTRDDISKLFSRKLGVPYYEEPEELTGIARDKLREEFLNADMGVSGVNFAVPETGTIVVVENEGNACLCTTLPRVHVALMGMEKVVPRFEDLSIFLNLLIKSATGQKLSTYVSFITGPKNILDNDGPEEFHLVILDNGRSKILADEVTRQSLYCLRCGACLNVCPVYRQVGGHAYGGVYSGPIGAIIMPQLMDLKGVYELPYASSLCGACKEVCPVNIDFPKVLLKLRSDFVKGREKGRRPGLSERMAIKLWRYAMEHRRLYEFISRIAYFAQMPFVERKGRRNGHGRIGSLPFPFSNWTRDRDFPAVAKKTFRNRWRELENENGDSEDKL